MGNCSSANKQQNSSVASSLSPPPPIHIRNSEKEEQLQEATQPVIEDTIPYEQRCGLSKLDQQMIESSKLPNAEPNILTVTVGERNIPMCKMRKSYSPVAS